jgi:guanosine-3',5'-bis(diphosphate) 3'-pyrophosphohydrolase
MYNDAFIFAITKHRGQLYGKKPYALHLAQVVSVLYDFNVNQYEYVVAGFLHDLLEDTNTTAEEIYEAFGSQVEMLVQAVTTHGNTRNEKLVQLLRQLTACPKAIPLKLADRIANVEACRRDNNQTLLNMYRNENPTLIAHIKPLTEHHQDMIDYLEKILIQPL